MVGDGLELKRGLPFINSFEEITKLTIKPPSYI